MVDAEDGAQTAIHHIDPKTIKVRRGWNCRDFNDPENQEHIERLANSIREIGVKEPLTVVMEGKSPVLVNGESRLRAIKLLAKDGHKVETVPVQLDDPEIDEASKFAEQISRNSGKPYTVLEQCAVFCRLRDLGWNDKQIGDHAGLTDERARQIISLEMANEAVRKLIHKGKVSATLVQRVIAKSDSSEEVDEAINEAMQRAVTEGASKVGPRHLKTKEKPADAPPPTPDPDLPFEPMEQERVSSKNLLNELLRYVDKEPKMGADTVTVTMKVPRSRWERISGRTYK